MNVNALAEDLDRFNRNEISMVVLRARQEGVLRRVIQQGGYLNLTKGLNPPQIIALDSLLVEVMTDMAIGDF